MSRRLSPANEALYKELEPAVEQCRLNLKATQHVAENYIELRIQGNLDLAERVAGKDFPLVADEVRKTTAAFQSNLPLAVIADSVREIIEGIWDLDPENTHPIVDVSVSAQKVLREKLKTDLHLARYQTQIANMLRAILLESPVSAIVHAETEHVPQAKQTRTRGTMMNWLLKEWDRRISAALKPDPDTTPPSA